MFGSMVDIQPAAAEIRQGKRRRKERITNHMMKMLRRAATRRNMCLHIVKMMGLAPHGLTTVCVANFWMTELLI